MDISPCIRRDFLDTIGRSSLGTLLAASSLGLNVSCGGVPQVKKPNIVLIMADDMGFSDIGCYGGEISTPNIDRLAAGGLRFTQFYNNAICVPTRASLLSGLYSQQVGVWANSPKKMINCVTLAEVLRGAGYRTLMTGKWHALDYLDEYSHEDKPFFLYLAYTAPHYPLHALPEDIA